jgi:hypothetical protein
MKRLWIGLAAAALCAVPALASSVIGLTIEDQARLAKHVVLGTVVSQVGVDDPENGIETEVTITVKRDLKGIAAKGDTLVFRTRSGQVGDEVSAAEGEAVFHTGKPVLVFLEDIDGQLHNLGLSMGVFSVSEDKNGRVHVRRDIQDGLEIMGDTPVEMGPLPLEAMAARVKKAIDQPAFDSPVLREAKGDN